MILIKPGEDKQYQHVVAADEEALYNTFFINCHNLRTSVMKGERARVKVSFELVLSQANPGPNYLPAGQMEVYRDFHFKNRKRE